MIHRTTKLRFRRVFRKRKRQVEDIGEQADLLAEKHFFRRLNRLAEVRRFVVAWVLLLVALTGVTISQTIALDSIYQSEQPVPGGTLTEGIVGSFTNASPLYATGVVDNAASRLIFAGLLKHNQENQLVANLAERWQEEDESGLRYVVNLRKDVRWHDGTPFTSHDVVFTYTTIQKPDAKSPLINSWRDIKIEAADDHTVVFTLPNSFSSFPQSLTTGIVPRHLLKYVPLTQLRSHRFNNFEPVGAGPFRWANLEVSGTGPEDRQEKIGLAAYDNYHGEKPKLDKLIIHSFRQEDKLVQAFKNKEIDAMTGIDTVSEKLENQIANLKEYSVPLTSQVNVFFKNTQEILSDQKVRQSLVRAVSVSELVSGLGYPTIASHSPLLPRHTGYSKDTLQLSYDVSAANVLLDEAGWLHVEDGEIRQKEGKDLTFRLLAENTAENVYITQHLQKKWREVGMYVNVDLMPKADVQSSATQHNYDALLYAIALGPDPDVYAYWHSSQFDVRSPTRLNFSEYKSTQADTALEAGRTRSDEDVRAVKYQPFLSAWVADAPALALFQSRFLYLSHDKIHGFEPKSMNMAADRYVNVENWMIRQEKVNK